MVAFGVALACGGAVEPPAPPSPVASAPPAPAPGVPAPPEAPAAPKPIPVKAEVCGEVQSLLVYPPSGAASGDLLSIADDHLGIIRTAPVNPADLAVYGWVVAADGYAMWWFEPDVAQTAFLQSVPDRVGGCHGAGDGFVKWDGGVVSVYLADRRFRTSSGLGPGASARQALAAATRPPEPDPMGEGDSVEVGRLTLTLSDGVVDEVAWSSR